MLLYISFFLFVLALVLIIYNWKLNNNAVFIGLFFSLIAIYGLVHHFVVYGKSVFWLALVYNHFSPFFLLAGPFLYFYVRGTLKDRQYLKRKDLLHFIPATIHLLSIMPYCFTSFSYKESVAKMIVENIDNLKKISVNIFFDSQFNFILRIALLALYLGYSIYLVYKFSKKKKKLNNIPLKQYTIIYRWLILLLSLVSLMLINFSMLCYYFLYIGDSHLKFVVIVINTTIAASLVFLIFGMLFFPEILYGLSNNNLPKTKISGPTIKPKSDLPVSSIILKSEKDEDPLVNLSERILVYFENEKPYLNPNFSILQIAQKMGVPQNHVSYCIKSVFQTKFSKLKTKLRVEQTKVFLKESLHSNITIDGVSQLAGFSSRSNFYNAFKDETGITPSDYLKSVKEIAELENLNSTD